MKTYTFTVKIEDDSTSSSFIDDLKAEIQSEEAQLKLTHEVNKKTSEVLKKVLEDFLEPINDELNKVGLGFKDHKDNISATNKCNDHYFIMRLPKIGRSYVIGIFGSPDRNFPSKYTTCTGDFKIMLGLNASPSYTACQKDKLPTLIKNSQEVFTTIRDRVKKEIMKT